MNQYKELLQSIFDEGVIKSDRTGVGTISKFGHMSRFNLQQGFPIVTEKKTFFRSAVIELLWMIGGWRKLPEYAGLQPTNIKYLLDNKVKIWTEWPYKAYCIKAEINGNDALTQTEYEQKIVDDIEFAKEYGDLGPVYQKQWRDFEGKKERVDQLKNMVNRLQENPDCRRNLSSYWNPTELSEMLLPPCFIAGTSIKTNNGYSNIEDLDEGNLIISDKGNAQKINNKWITDYQGEMYVIRPWYSLPIESTGNHPYLISDNSYKIAKDLTLNDWLAIKKNKEYRIPQFSFKQGINQYQQEVVNIDMSRMDYWYLMGYFLGDGWIINKSEKIQLSIATKDLEKVLGRISDTGSWCIINNSGINVKKVETKNKKLNFLLSKLGKYSYGKFIPDFIESAPSEYIKVFLEGYADADGCYDRNERITYSTVSKNIALGLQSLYAKLGQACSIIEGNKKEKDTYIQGRRVKTRKCYNVTPSNDNRFARNSEDYLYIKIKEINKTSLKNCLVYNFDVNNDNTYIANNICNHNCHMMHQVWTRELTEDERRYMYKEINNGIYVPLSHQEMDRYNVPKRALSLQMYQRSSDSFLGVPFDWVFYSLLTHMLAEVSNMTVGDFIWLSGDTHLYLNSLDASKEVLSRESYPYPKLKINRKVSDIEGFKLEDFELIGYEFHPAIKVQVAV